MSRKTSILWRMRCFRPLRRQVAPLNPVLVDDASTDDTWAQIQAIQARDARVRGIRHLKNAGQSAAVWTGFQHTDTPLLATLDGDRQNDPADLPTLLSELKDCDFVAAKGQNGRILSSVKPLPVSPAGPVRHGWALILRILGALSGSSSGRPSPI